MKKYYKTNCKKVLGAINEMNNEKGKLVSKINNIALNFNAKAMTSTSMSGVGFGGLVLNNYHGFSWGKSNQSARIKSYGPHQTVITSAVLDNH